MAALSRVPHGFPVARPLRAFRCALVPLLFALVIVGPRVVRAMPEQGNQTIIFSPSACFVEGEEVGKGEVVTTVILSAYNRSTISLYISGCPAGGMLYFEQVAWTLQSYRCYNRLAIAENAIGGGLCNILEADDRDPAEVITYTKFSKGDTGASPLPPHNCSLPFNFSMGPQDWFTVTVPTTATTTTTTTTKAPVQDHQKETKKSKRRRKQVDEDATNSTKSTPAAEGASTSPTVKTMAPATSGITASSLAPSTSSKSSSKALDPVCDSALLIKQGDGVFVFMLSLKLKAGGNVPDDFNASKLTGSLVVKGPQGYLQAIDWPCLPFYAVMFVLYAIYLIIWLVLCCYYRKDILRVQYWIGAVILLGLLEKTVYLGEYNTLNTTGHSSVSGAIIFGELLSCAKRTLSRMLVVIVSVGFGIVRPRLGPTLHKILAMGVLYYIICAVEGCIRATSTKMEFTRTEIIPVVALAVIDAAICWWVFTGLIQTMRTLRVRRNLVKLSLYRHFTNTLIFSVLASIAFMIWSLKQHKFQDCLQDWKELWVDDAFWHLLFSILIAVIMVLWRPSANNQRYAYSPLLDAEDDEAEEPMMNDAFDGIKLRQKSTENGTKSRHRDNNQTEDDLKWIEENIPPSLADSALPSLLDSEEELAATNYEISKTH